ncbi:asparagine--tRNA ligase [Candidatus Micrarchaeota archaeon CG1_02_51_15]|nr:MAG: asparagine--tRNA ligase [Candidatus Micrarchaeota archaeon CG1_02_51_15]
MSNEQACFTPIEEVLSSNCVGKEVSVRGWVYRARTSGAMLFLVIRDSTDIIQATVKKDRVSEQAWKNAEACTRIESAVTVKGVVAKDDRATGGFELQATDFTAIHAADVFPIAKDNSEEWLLDIRHLSIRSRELTAVMKVKATVLAACREFFEKKGYWETTPPIIASGACEGGSTTFNFDYFGKKAILSQSAQLYLEALIFSLEKVYAITPSFRAEKSRTLRHLAEYWHVEGEEAHMNFEQLIAFEEEMISFICQKTAKERPKELELLGRNPEEMLAIAPPFPRMAYAKAIEILKQKGMPVEFGDDLGADEEKILTAEYKKPILLTHFPAKIKAFYMKRDPTDENLVLGADILAPEGYGEIIGSSQREEDNELLISRLRADGSDPAAFAWYLDLRKYGSVPHSGFGMGIERLVRWICKLDHIRDAIPFPRVINRVYP